MQHIEDLDELLAEVKDRMHKAVAAISEALAKVRTGRASTKLLEDLRVEYYGTQTPLNQLATLTVPEPRAILIQPFDPSSTGAIEKAIMQSELGLNPNTSGDAGSQVIRVMIPELSEERRKDLVRYAGKEAEEGRISVRNVRREANDVLKKHEKDGTLSEDDARGGMDEIQKLTDKHIEQIDALLAQKEQDLLEV